MEGNVVGFVDGIEVGLNYGDKDVGVLVGENVGILLGLYVKPDFVGEDDNGLVVGMTVVGCGVVGLKEGIEDGFRVGIILG